MFFNKIGVLLTEKLKYFINKGKKRLVGDDGIEPHSLCECFFNKGGGIQTDQSEHFINKGKKRLVGDDGIEPPTLSV